MQQGDDALLKSIDNIFVEEPWCVLGRFAELCLDQSAVFGHPRLDRLQAMIEQGLVAVVGGSPATRATSTRSSCATIVCSRKRWTSLSSSASSTLGIIALAR